MRTEKDRELTKGEMLRSVFLFVLHGVILLAIVAVLLFGDKLGSIGETFAQNAANYLYMLFCIVLVVGILYFYFLFENRSVLASGKNITLIFLLTIGSLFTNAATVFISFIVSFAK